jgi:hypothetical protein
MISLNTMKSVILIGLYFRSLNHIDDIFLYERVQPEIVPNGLNLFPGCEGPQYGPMFYCCLRYTGADCSISSIGITLIMFLAVIMNVDLDFINSLESGMHGLARHFTCFFYLVSFFMVSLEKGCSFVRLRDFLPIVI